MANGCRCYLEFAEVLLEAINQKTRELHRDLIEVNFFKIELELNTIKFRILPKLKILKS